MESPSLAFASAVRTICAATRARHLMVPGFRSPPRRPGLERTLRWRPDGTATVSVAVRVGILTGLKRAPASNATLNEATP